MSAWPSAGASFMPSPIMGFEDASLELGNSFALSSGERITTPAVGMSARTRPRRRATRYS